MLPKPFKSLLGRDGEQETKEPFRLVTEPEPGLDFLLVEAFITPAECDFLVESFKRLQYLTMKNPGGDPFWDDRFLWFTSIPSTEVNTQRLMQQSRRRIAAALRDFYHEGAEIYNDTIQLVMWPPGVGMPAHADNSHPDNAPHGTPFRDYASVVYLNEDFEGGEFYFERSRLLIKPRKGLLIAFKGGVEHRHGVRPAHSGTRFTMPGWYTKDKSHADETFFIDY